MKCTVSPSEAAELPAHNSKEHRPDGGFLTQHNQLVREMHSLPSDMGVALSSIRHNSFANTD